MKENYAKVLMIAGALFGSMALIWYFWICAFMDTDLSRPSFPPPATALDRVLRGPWNRASG